MNLVLKLKNDMTELDKLHGFIEEFGRKFSLSKKHVNAANLALEEVVSNIVAYAYEDSGDHFIKIRVIPPVNGALVLRVEDKGRRFNPLDVAQPELTYDLENCGIGGLGVHLVKRLMDEVSYEYREPKNILEMKKTITSKCGGPSGNVD